MTPAVLGCLRSQAPFTAGQGSALQHDLGLAESAHAQPDDLASLIMLSDEVSVDAMVRGVPLIGFWSLGVLELGLIRDKVWEKSTIPCSKLLLSAAKVISQVSQFSVTAW